MPDWPSNGAVIASREPTPGGHSLILEALMNEKPWKYAKSDDGERRLVEFNLPSRKRSIGTWDRGDVEINAQLTGKATLVDADENREPASQVDEDGRIGYKSDEAKKIFWVFDPESEV